MLEELDQLSLRDQLCALWFILNFYARHKADKLKHHAKIAITHAMIAISVFFFAPPPHHPPVVMFPLVWLFTYFFVLYLLPYEPNSKQEIIQAHWVRKNE